MEPARVTKVTLVVAVPLAGLAAADVVAAAGAPPTAVSTAAAGAPPGQPEAATSTPRSCLAGSTAKAARVRVRTWRSPSIFTGWVADGSITVSS